MSVITSSAPTALHISVTNQSIVKIRPRRGARFSNFYPQPPVGGPSLSNIDSAFQLQEYISQLIRKDPHNVEAIVTIPVKQKTSSNEYGKDEASEDTSGSNEDNKEPSSKIDHAVDESCWIYEHLRRLAQDLTHPLIVLLQQECTRSSCPEMKAGEWMYLCVAHGNDGAMEQCCAIDYILHTLDSATALLNSPRAFPSRLQIPSASTRHFPSLARRLGRIFAHAYCHHREAFETAESENSLYARFLALSSKFNLVPPEFLTVPGGPNSTGPSLGAAAPPPASPSSSYKVESDLFAKDDVQKVDGLGKMFSDFNPPNAKAPTAEYDDTSRYDVRKEFSYPPPGAVTGFGPSFTPGISTFTRPLDPEKAELGRTNALKNAATANTRKVGRNRTDTMVHSDAYAQAYLSGNGNYANSDNADSEAQNRALNVEESGHQVPTQAYIVSDESGSQMVPLQDEEDKAYETHIEENEKGDFNEEEVIEENIDPHAEIDIVDDAAIVIGFDQVQHVGNEEAESTEERSQMKETNDVDNAEESKDITSSKSAHVKWVIDNDYIIEDPVFKTSSKPTTTEAIQISQSDATNISDTLADAEVLASSSLDNNASQSNTASTSSAADTTDTKIIAPVVSESSASKTKSPPVDTTDTVQEDMSSNNTGSDDEQLGFPSVSNLIQLSNASGQQCLTEDHLPSSSNTSEVDESSVESISNKENLFDDSFRELPNLKNLKILSNDEAESCHVLPAEDPGEKKLQFEENELPDLKNLTLLSNSGPMCVVADVDDEAPIPVKTETEDHPPENDIDSSGYVVLDKADDDKNKAEEEENST